MKKLFLILFFLYPIFAAAHEHRSEFVVNFPEYYPVRDGSQFDIREMLRHADRPAGDLRNAVFDKVEIYTKQENRNATVAIYDGRVQVDSKYLHRGYAALNDRSGRGVSTIIFNGMIILDKIVVHSADNLPKHPDYNAYNPPPPRTPQPPPSRQPQKPQQRPKPTPKLHDVTIADFVKKTSKKEPPQFNISQFTAQQGFSRIALQLETPDKPLIINQVLIIDKSGRKHWTKVTRSYSTGRMTLDIPVPQGARDIRFSLDSGLRAHIIIKLIR